jgi:hypothetical protein
MAVARTLGVTRSNLVDQLQRPNDAAVARNAVRATMTSSLPSAPSPTNGQPTATDVSPPY